MQLVRFDPELLAMKLIKKLLGTIIPIVRKVGAVTALAAFVFKVLTLVLKLALFMLCVVFFILEFRTDIFGGTLVGMAGTWQVFDLAMALFSCVVLLVGVSVLVFARVYISIDR